MVRLRYRTLGKIKLELFKTKNIKMSNIWFVLVWLSGSAPPW